jgi:hypothetical protein
MSYSNLTYDIMPSTVPKLKQSGANWAVFQLRLQMAVRGKGLWGHFDGTKPWPIEKLPAVSVSPLSLSSAGKAVSSSATSSSPDPNATILLGTPGEIAEWEHCKDIMWSLLSQCLLNSTLIVVDSQPSVAKMWETVVKEFTYKGTFLQTHMCQSFLASHCPKNGDVQNFLHNL